MLVIASFLILTIFPVPINALYEQPELLNSKVSITLTFDKNDFEFEKYDEYDLIKYAQGGLTSNIGEPMLPLKNILVAIPKDMKAIKVKIHDYVEEELPSTFNIFPAQEPQKVGVSIKKSSYSQNIGLKKFLNFYSYKKVELNGMTDLAGQGIAIVTVYPLQYNPYLKTLKLIKEINFEVECENGYTYGDYLPNSVTESEIDLYKEKVKEMVFNPGDVKLQSDQGHQPLGVDPGDYDYVIITKNSWTSAFQELADWKTQKGIPANIVTTEWIYSNYSGSDNQAKIRAFIQDAYNNWGTTMILIGGDSDTVPYKTVTYEGDNIPTDTYYADFDDDWTCEVDVGRASITGTGTGVGKIGNFINKSFTYERNPPTSNYAKNVALFGFDLDWLTDGEDVKIDIDNLYIPSGWTVTKVYDSHSGNHEDNVVTAVNNGQNIINHIDHSGEYSMGVGYTNHGDVLDTSEVDAFSNGNKQCVWYSIGCWAEAFDYSNCIAEHFVRDDNGGGVGFVGNTRYGWYYVGSDDQASNRYDRYFFRSFFNQNHYKLGDIFSDHKNDAYTSMSGDDLNKYIFSELNLLGDPELPLWQDNPSNFDVTHLTEIPIGSSSFTVHVEDTSGTDIENAYVCLWKGDEIYLTDYTNINGDAIFSVSPTTEGNMSVTITKQDYKPYGGYTYVSGANQPPNIPSDPIPANGATGVVITSGLSWNCSDPDGDPLTYDVYFGTSSSPAKVSTNQTSTIYDPGTLNFGTTYYWKIIAWDDSDASAEGPIWSFTTIFNDPPNTPSNPDPANGETDVDINADLSWAGGDPNGDTVTYDVYFGTSSPPSKVSSGQYTITYDPGTMNYLTTYYWKIEAEDEHGATTMGPEWSFTTEDEPANFPPEFSSENPVNGAIGVPISTTSLSVIITDAEGDSFDWSIETSPNIGNNGGTIKYNGTKTCTVSGLAYSTVFTWYVNATDSGSGETTSEVYTFTTEEEGNNPPGAPTITGPNSGNAGTSYDYSFKAVDPEGDYIYYYIEWGDFTNSGWLGPYSSSETIVKSHTWFSQGTYIISAKAKDIYNQEGPSEQLIVNMPRNKASYNTLFLKLLERFPIIQLLLQRL